MAIQLQSVELITRIRRALGIRGALDTPLDQTAVQTINVLDASGPPFRSNGYNWYLSFNRPAVAGQVNVVRVRPPVGSWLTLDLAMLNNDDAANPRRIRFGTAARSTNVVGPAVTGELTPPAGFGQIGVGVTFDQFTTAAFPFGNLWGEIRVAAGFQREYRPEFTIQPEAELIVENAVANESFFLTLQGRLFNP